ncbi:MAG TPA: tetratricopeptide repeat protein [Candidatus Dormibacteraeota bacterium]|nr:tetratricopeptide repeat protein [Candidatus Dormibacteraeota bacterium]
MAQHILRKDLKKDEIRETFVHGVESVASHQTLLWIVVAAAIVVALGYFGWSSYSRRQTAKAEAGLDGAMQVFQARIRAPNESAAPGEITYVDEKNKFTDANQKFLAIANQYSRTKPGQVARYYAALSEIQLKQYAEAEKNLSQLSSADENLAGLAQFQLAGVYLHENKDSEAVALYRKLADKPSVFVPKPMVLLTLAGYYRKKDPAQAAKLYNEVKLEFPDAAQQADDGLELLNAKS